LKRWPTRAELFPKEERVVYAFKRIPEEKIIEEIGLVDSDAGWVTNKEPPITPFEYNESNPDFLNSVLNGYQMAICPDYFEDAGHVTNTFDMCRSAMENMR
jgi:hypothetical protein